MASMGGGRGFSEGFQEVGALSEKRVPAFALPLPLKGFAQFAFFRGSRASVFFQRGFQGGFRWVLDGF